MFVSVTTTVEFGSYVPVIWFGCMSVNSGKSIVEVIYIKFVITVVLLPNTLSALFAQNPKLSPVVKNNVKVPVSAREKSDVSE